MNIIEQLKNIIRKHERRDPDIFYILVKMKTGEIILLGYNENIEKKERPRIKPDLIDTFFTYGWKVLLIQSTKHYDYIDVIKTHRLVDNQIIYSEVIYMNPMYIGDETYIDYRDKEYIDEYIIEDVELAEEQKYQDQYIPITNII